MLGWRTRAGTSICFLQSGSDNPARQSIEPRMLSRTVPRHRCSTRVIPMLSGLERDDLQFRTAFEGGVT